MDYMTLYSTTPHIHVMLLAVNCLFLVIKWFLAFFVSYSDILEPTGEEVLRSSPTISSPSPSLTRDDDESSNSSSLKGGAGASIGTCERMKKEHELAGSTEIMELAESPKPTRKSPKTKVGNNDEQYTNS